MAFLRVKVFISSAFLTNTMKWIMLNERKPFCNIFVRKKHSKILRFPPNQEFSFIAQAKALVISTAPLNPLRALRLRSYHFFQGCTLLNWGNKILSFVRVSTKPSIYFVGPKIYSLFMKDKKNQALKFPLTNFAAVEVLALLFESIPSLHSSCLLCSKPYLLSVFQHCYQLEITFHPRTVFFLFLCNSIY